MIGALLAAAAIASPAVDTLLPGVYTNEEQVYFAREAGKPVPTWSGLRITGAAPAFQMQRIDGFGVAIGPAQPFNIRETIGQVAITDEAEPQSFTLPMRNVAWPTGNNQPSALCPCR